jgi:hypothetical protein
LKQDFERLNEIICLSIKAIEESEQWLYMEKIQ